MTWCRAVTWVLLFVLTGCASSRVVLLDTGQRHPLRHVPPTWDRSVTVDASTFEQSLARLVLDVPLSLRAPAETGLVRTSTRGTTLDTTWRATLRRDYGRWCQAHEAPRDCLSLLDGGLGFSPTDKLMVVHVSPAP